MSQIWIRPMLHALTILILFPLSGIAAPAHPATPVENPRLAPEQALAAVLGGGEIGANDFRLSDMGPDGEVLDYGAERPHLACNASCSEVLVVWSGADDGPGLVPNEIEVFGQRYQPAVEDYTIYLPLVLRGTN
ncbi:MAG: hypothetical protein RBT75_17770 [Anaerolineae bacterium]|jgi:hypothetical protein|nr:hypothetical protein [Anaerolineae bacterium]